MNLSYAQFPWLSTLLLLCIGGLVTILAIPGSRPREIKRVSAVYSGLTLVISAALFVAYDKHLGGLQFVEKIEWVPSMGITYFNGVDGFSLPMLLLKKPPQMFRRVACIASCGSFWISCKSTAIHVTWHRKLQGRLGTAKDAAF